MSTLLQITPGSKLLISTAERVGDAIFCTPGIRFLKKHRPDVQLDILAFGPGAAEVFANNPDVQTVHICTDKRTIQQLAGTYSSVINLMPEFLKYLSEISVPLSSIGNPDLTKHRAEQILEYLSHLLNCSIEDNDRKYQIYTQAKDFITVEQLLKQQAVDFQRDILIGCHLGCHRVAKRGWQFWRRNRHQHKKVWDLQNYLALAKQLHERNSHYRLVITGAVNERFLAKPFTKQTPWVIDLVGKTSLFEVAALMHYLTVYVTHDTGTLHIACASQVPLVALFGPTQVNFTGPYPFNANYTIIQKATMANIIVDEVSDIVLKKLTKTPNQ